MVTLFLWRLGIHSYFNFLSGGGRNKNFIETCCIFTPSVRATLVRNEEIFSSCVARLQEDIMSFPGNSVMELSFPSRRRRWRESRIYLDFNSWFYRDWSRGVTHQPGADFFFLRSPGTGMWSRESMCVFWGNEVLKHLFAVPLLWTKAY